MKLEDLKGQTIDDAMLAELLAFAQDLQAQRDAARQESIAGRKGKDAKLAEQKALIDLLAERLGVDPAEAPDSWPEAPGQAAAAKQFEARIKRAEREREASAAELAQLQQRYSGERRALALEKAIASQPFIDADVVRAVMERALQAEGEDFFYAHDGKLMPLADGAALLAKAKPHLVKAPGAGTQGGDFRAGGGAGGSGAAGAGGAATLDMAAIYAARRPDALKTAGAA